ncbi:MAG TPA: NADP-dependent isocitrate dehydrogenase [Euryarchaeota archaeon]|nr:NADP-dependent isocitrate dehydrogenase [Euryarchaeota archaeon]
MALSKISWTKVDEAPALATFTLLPVVSAFTRGTGVELETRDISLAGRIIANFPDNLTAEQKIPDNLALLGALTQAPEANIVKLPNISASIPQLQAAIKELREKGYDIPDYPEEPENEEEMAVRDIYDTVKGSAVNPVLREGNSDRRAPESVKNYARKHPYPITEWNRDSRSHVSHMTGGDLRSNEISTTLDASDAGAARIEFVDRDGNVRIMKERLPLLDGEVIDITKMSRKALRQFLEEQVEDAKRKEVLFSVHLKATMMKVSDPIIFGHVVSVYFRDVFEKYGEIFHRLQINPNNGLGELYAKISELPDDQREEIERSIRECMDRGPELAMVNSEKGITNLHVPSDVIIDASMPAAIKNGGRMWGRDGELHDTKFVIPDSSYAGVYKTVVEFCKENGAFDPRTMGTVQNVGLMAQKAEEYGSHDKTFLCPGDGTVRVISAAGRVLLERDVEEGDIFRMCQVKDLPIRDWIKLAVTRARATEWPTIFWLDRNRPHDRELIEKIDRYLPEHDTNGLDIRIMSPEEATLFSCRRLKEGKNTISVTGNVLRDYLTDLFPILEVGTSARMLSIVPLMNGGGLFETGAGGSAPKHVQQFLEEGHLRWDSLGEFLAMTASLEHHANRTGNRKAAVIGKALDKAIEMYLENNRSPSRKVHELDNRGSHFYLAMYWASALAQQNEDGELKDRFKGIADELKKNESGILEELDAAQGKPVDIGGYYKPEDELASRAMRCSPTFNNIIDSIGK